MIDTNLKKKAKTSALISVPVLFFLIVTGCTASPHIKSSNVANTTLTLSSQDLDESIRQQNDRHSTRNTDQKEHPSMVPLARRITRYVTQNRFRHAHWGISIRSLDTHRILYEYQGDKLAVPASNTKLFTAALALSILPDQYRIRTTLYAEAPPHQGIVPGNIILYGRGDPTLGNHDDSHTQSHWAARMAAQLRKKGIKRIKGDLIVDTTYFRGSTISPGWEARDLRRWYAPPVSAMTVQGNMFYLRVSPSNGTCCRISTRPKAAKAHVVNLATTDAKANWNDLDVYRPPFKNITYLHGTIRPHAKTRYFVLSDINPAQVAGDILKQALKHRGIQIDGHIKTVHWPQKGPAHASLPIVAEVRSPVIADVVTHALKHSDNLYAQLLFMQVGAYLQHNHPEAIRSTQQRSQKAMRHLLTTIGIKQRATALEEGSGLSRKDITTPDALTRLLEWVNGQTFAPAFHAALPVAGVDGTLKNRMKKAPAQGNLHAKTGTLRHSYTLSGYVTSIAGEHLAFSFMLDNYIRLTNHPRKDLDALAQMLANLDKPVLARGEHVFPTTSLNRNAIKKKGVEVE